jgi:protein O-GlcNAc transferase
VHTFSDEKLAQQIQEDQIDILVDLSGHTGGNRLLTFARQPAPVQISAWGNGSGTGMTQMDAIFSDECAVLPEEKKFFAEKVINLPCLICYNSEATYVPIQERSRQSSLIVGSTNNFSKITPETIVLWSNLLMAIPELRLLVKARELGDPVIKSMFREKFLAYQIEGRRLILVPRSSRYRHLAVHNAVDITLDPIPMSGGITTCESLQMGVPVVTLKGKYISGRTTSCLMTAMGHPEFIARSESEYIEIVAQQLANLKQGLWSKKSIQHDFLTSPITDVRNYTRVVEKKYRELWQEWCSRKNAVSPS